jgi:hypothetical protein
MCARLTPAVGQVPQGPVRELGDLDASERLHHAVVAVLAAPAALDQPGFDVLAGGGRLDHAHLLEAAADALARPPPRCVASDVRLLEEDLGAVGLDEAADDVQEGGLARPVRADEAADLTGSDRERDVVQDLQAADPEADVLAFEQRRHGGRHAVPPATRATDSRELRARRRPALAMS